MEFRRIFFGGGKKWLELGLHPDSASAGFYIVFSLVLRLQAFIQHGFFTGFFPV